MKTSIGSLLPGAVLLALVVVPASDTTLTRLPGYGGVIPVPFVSEELISAVTRLEILSSRASEGKEGRGRVLYANDHASRGSETVRTARDKRPCSQSLAPSRTSATPNS